MFIPDPFTSPSNIASGAAITSSGINTLKSPYDTALTTIGGYTIENRNSNDTVTSTELINFCTAAGGNIALTLPDASSSRGKMFVFKKYDQSFNTVTLNRAGSDTIEDPVSPLTTPTATSLTLRLPDETVYLWVPPATTTWRILQRLNPYITNLGASGYTSTATALGAATYSSVSWNNEYYDVSGSLSGTTYTCKVAGTYQVNGTVGIYNASSTVRRVAILINGVTLYEVAYSPAMTGDFNTPFSGTFRLSAGDTIQVQGYSTAASGNIRSGSQVSLLSISCIHARY